MEKKCSKCQQNKPVSEFYKDSDGLFGVRSDCKTCWKKESHIKFLTAKQNHTDRKCTCCHHHKKAKEFSVRQAMCKECKRIKQIIWRKSNPNYRDNTKKYEEKIKRLNTPVYQRIQLVHKLRSRIREAIKKQKTTKVTSTTILLGCTIPELKAHLESKFTNGMSWELINQSKIHLAHIVPCSSFNLSNPEEQRKCFHFTNLQPLWAADNLSKGNRI